MTDVFLHILVLLIATNGAPVIVAFLCGSHGALPLDLGRQCADGRPVFGVSKTWRGLASALVTSTVLAWFFGYGLDFGLAFGALVITGDLCSSFIKRRLGLEPSSKCPGLDQLPESLLPSVYAVVSLDMVWWWAPVFAVTFMLIEILVSKPLYWLHIRNRPY
jgi:CDP-diglyceride synthetase